MLFPLDNEEMSLHGRAPEAQQPMFHGPGKIEFKASMKELAVPLSASRVEMPQGHELNIKPDVEIEYVDADHNPLMEVPVAMY